MKTMSMFWAIVGMVWLAGCAVIDIDRTANFNQYKTFGWGKVERSSVHTAYKYELLDANIKSTIQTEFKKKGLIFTSKKPDVLVSYQTATEEKIAHSGGGPYYYPALSFWYFPNSWSVMGWSGPYWNTTQADYSYTEGTFILKVTDRKTGKQIWRGMVQGSIDNVRSLNKTVTRGIKVIIKKYPDERSEKPSLIPIPKNQIS